MKTSSSFPSHEMIGMQAQVVESSDSQIIGIQGIIVNETKSMFKFDTEKGIKTIPKINSKWRFLSSASEIVLEGAQLVERPEDREMIK